MAVNRGLMCALVVALLVSGLASAPSALGGDNKNSLPQFIARSQAGRDNEDLNGRQHPAGQTRTTRTDRLAHLSEDEREFMSKQIMQAISEILSSECTADRDYQGWVDFGRRSAE